MVRFAQTQPCCRRNSGIRFSVLFALAALLPSANAMAAGDGVPLQLEVFINDQPTGLIGAFTLAPDARLDHGARAAGDRHPPAGALASATGSPWKATPK